MPIMPLKPIVRDTLNFLHFPDSIKKNWNENASSNVVSAGSTNSTPDAHSGQNHNASSETVAASKLNQLFLVGQLQGNPTLFGPSMQTFF